MCIGELIGDTLGARDQDYIRDRCVLDLPVHDLTLHSNDAGVTWAVLSPPSFTPQLLRFTICRVAPSVMVMIEDQDARRQFRGLGSVEEAVAFVSAAASEAMLAVPGMHMGTGAVH